MSLAYYLKRIKKFIFDIGLGKFIGISVLIAFLGAVVFASLHQVNTMQKASKARIVENGTFTEGFVEVNIPLTDPNGSCPEVPPELESKIYSLVPEEYKDLIDLDAEKRKVRVGENDYNGFDKKPPRGRDGFNKEDFEGIKTDFENNSKYVCKAGTIASGWQRYSQNDLAFQWFLNGEGFQLVSAAAKGIGTEQKNLSLDVNKTYQISTEAEGDIEGAVVLLRDPTNDKVVEFPLNSINEFVVEQDFVPTDLLIFSKQENVVFKINSVSIVDYTTFADENEDDNGDEANLPPVDGNVVNTKDCKVGGACGESCVEKDSPDIKRPCDERTSKIAQCIQDSGAICGKVNDGACDWIPTNAPALCEKKVDLEEGGEDNGGENGDVSCIVTGCNGEICTEEGNIVSTICVFKPEYECLKKAKCEVQPGTNRCGWTKTEEYYACMKDVVDTNINF